ncbi:3-hydroxyisobutyryl-CoA hydrolase [Methylobacterium sp. Leaf399]|uniref:enoyl-CoA hydratase/isomerase family protein n=1 Tax=Methylobacterium sp. Leaf399 TaxID=1736364 RepID=UPI0006FFCB8C|nr:enoyl-CoA hydratase/isomerase family protein [Methylobacterium sp. Leaf399]KQT19524.1 3-hydroxyisobutyryl-CoA hydrolase [Methylobacterium sp. Leaf399]
MTQRAEQGAERGAEPEILFERRGAAGLVTLNRPKALNALSLAMIAALHAALDAWERDAAVTRVVIRAAGGRAFCAGGDIRRVYDQCRAGQDEAVRAFWSSEYRLNAAVKRYPKPVVSLIEGIVMGGGVGISLHGSHRVASGNYGFAMPEVGIGFFPDVGMTYALPRLPGRAGTYLALTGSRIGIGDALALGLATHHVAPEAIAAVVAALAEGGPVDDVLAAHAAPPPPPGPLAAARGLVDGAFAADSVLAVLAALDRAAAGSSIANSTFAAETAALIRTRSPTSVAIAHEQMRRGVGLDVAQALALEYRLALRVTASHDFFEGVRAVLVDKDGAPAWSPATPEAVDPAAIAAFFAPLDGPEPDFGPAMGRDPRP